MRISLFWSSCEHFVLRHVSFQIGFSFLEVDCATMDFPKLLQGHEDNSVLDQAVNMLVVFNPFSFKFDFPLFFEIRLWPTWICQNWFKAMSIGLFWVKLWTCEFSEHLSSNWIPVFDFFKNERWRYDEQGKKLPPAYAAFSPAYRVVTLKASACMDSLSFWRRPHTYNKQPFVYSIPKHISYRVCLLYRFLHLPKSYDSKL